MESHVQHPRSASLTDITVKPRQFGFLLATLVLATIADQSAYVYAWMIVLLVYPWLMSLLAPSIKNVRTAMFIDGFLVGLLLSLVDFNLEVSVVLLALLAISSLIVGSLACLVPVLGVTAFGSLVGHFLHPDGFVGGESFYLLSFVSLIGYVIFIGIMVFDETKRLKEAHQSARTVTRELESFKQWITPFVPKAVRPELAERHPQRKRITVLFSDICGFTQLMDSMDEAAVASFLNDYFTEMADIAQQFGGNLHKFIGDGVMIFFGDSDSPGERAGNDAETCIAMALEMRDRFRKLSAHWQLVHGGKRLDLRIGIHSGYALVGEFGCAQRREYTALGGTVNLASRLESAAHPDEILISQDVVRLTEPHFRLLARGPLALRGLRKPVPGWGVLGRATLNNEAQLKLLG